MLQHPFVPVLTVFKRMGLADLEDVEVNTLDLHRSIEEWDVPIVVRKRQREFNFCHNVLSDLSVSLLIKRQRER
jgi:hypothetical protein